MGGVPGEPFVEAAAVDPLGVPGTLGDYVTDDRSPWKERWGGWFVTGKQVPAGHRSSASFANSGESEPLEWKLDAGAYLSANSDVGCGAVGRQGRRHVGVRRAIRCGGTARWVCPL